ncbi:MAG: hypothetical protein ABSB80_12415 [Methanoregula sp.]|jgi:hypothetical protein|uniref:hypothetical protein n=1 Tax=Methanoregula sp. TaxID=2052170 RepID=UPI003D152236
MSEKFNTDFEKILYVGLVDYAGKTLNSEEIAPLFKLKSPDERKAIKRAILKKLEESVKNVGKDLTEKSLADPNMIARHQNEVRDIIIKIFRGEHENK